MTYICCTNRPLFWAGAWVSRRGDSYNVPNAVPCMPSTQAKVEQSQRTGESVTISTTNVRTAASAFGRMPPPFCDRPFLLYLYYLHYLRNHLTSLLLVSVIVHTKRVYCADRLGRTRLRWLWQ